MDYLKDGLWDIAGMLKDGRTMTVAVARASGVKDPLTANESKGREFLAVNETGMVMHASWTYNRVIKNGGIRYTIIHGPSQRIVVRD